MSAVVLDASAAVAMLALTQTTPAATAFVMANTDQLIAPAVFALEVRHALVRLERRGVLAVAAADMSLETLEGAMDFALDPDVGERAAIIALARAAQLGVYDATYLHLALVRTAALASRDAQLLAVAQSRGVAVHDLR